MIERAESRSGFEGRQQVLLPARVVETSRRQKPLLHGLLATGAGYSPPAEGHGRRRPEGTDEAILIYCVKGRGWCEVAGRTLPVHAGDLLVLPPGLPHAYGTDDSDPWTIHWVHAAGANLPHYLRELGTSSNHPVLRVGDELQLVLLFNEILRGLGIGFTFQVLFVAG